MSIHSDLSIETIKAAPPLAVTSAMVMGISVSDWAAILTVIYVLLQIYFLLSKKYKEVKIAKALVPQKPEVEDAT